MKSMGRKEWPLEKQPINAMWFCLTCRFFHDLLLLNKTDVVIDFD